MIAKGASRSGPRQLAVYLMRVERWDTGEPAELLELLSPWAAGIDGGDRHHTADRLIEAFRDWQTLVEGTKQGRDGLYHAEINPEAHYAKNMTPEEWKRTADILAEELGLQGQPRALVLHAGKDDRPHLHVVWQRTDVEKMKVISDGYNYIAHERASHRMEKEFGHEFIPGKHAKRDRKRQKDFPREKLTQAEDQYQKGTGLSKEDRTKEIAALKAAADNGPAFKAALEDAGYILAKGDRGYVVVDQKGGHSVLSRNVGLKKKEIEAFMAGVELDKLPTVEKAKAVQADRRKIVSKSEAQPPEQKPEEKGVEASKFLEDQAAKKQPEAVQPQEDAGLEALKKKLAARQVQEMEKWAQYQAHELRQKEHELDVWYRDKVADFDALQQKERDALNARLAEKRTGIKGFIEALENRLNPTLAAEKAKERRSEIALLKRRQEKERADYLALQEQSRQLEIENLKERQALRRQDEAKKHTEEYERYTREYHDAKRIRQEVEAERRKEEERERNESLRDGPPPPELGKR
jgi:hypothetical protein